MNTAHLMTAPSNTPAPARAATHAGHPAAALTPRPHSFAAPAAPGAAGIHTSNDLSPLAPLLVSSATSDPSAAAPTGTITAAQPTTQNPEEPAAESRNMPAIIGTAENPTAREIALRAMRILLGESSEYGREACENALQTAIDEREESISATVTLAPEHPASSETAQEPAPSAHLENPDDTPGSALHDTALRYLHHELHGMGALENLTGIPHLSDIYVNGPADIWVQAAGQTQPTALTLGNEARVRSLAQRLIRASGGRLDAAHPAADVQDTHGRRIHAVIPPLVPRTHLSVRVAASRRQTLEDLEKTGMFDAGTAAELRSIIAEKKSFIISGGTGTGKTTLLNAMLALCPANERLLTLEDTPELAPSHPHVVAMMTRAANTEGTGEINLGELIVQALRMAPDRLIVGECRGAEITHLLTAMNTGHTGAGTSLHANSARAVPMRLAALGALAGLDARTVALHAATAFDRIIHLQKDGPTRRVEGIYELALEREELTVRPVPSHTVPKIQLSEFELPQYTPVGVPSPAGADTTPHLKLATAEDLAPSEPVMERRLYVA